MAGGGGLRRILRSHREFHKARDSNSLRPHLWEIKGATKSKALKQASDIPRFGFVGHRAPIRFRIQVAGLGFRKCAVTCCCWEAVLSQDR